MNKTIVSIALIVIISNLLAWFLMEATNAPNDQAVYYGIVSVAIGAFVGLKYYEGAKK